MENRKTDDYDERLSVEVNSPRLRQHSQKVRSRHDRRYWFVTGFVYGIRIAILVLSLWLLYIAISDPQSIRDWLLERLTQ